MTRPTTIDDILKLIEFELAQQSLPQDNISEAIQRLHKLQTYWHAEMLHKGRAPKMEEFANALFNANQTTLMLLQAINNSLEALKLESKKLKLLIEKGILEDEEENRSCSRELTYIKESLNILSQNLSRIRTLYSLEIQMRHSNLPIIGKFINRFRAAFHQLVYFYLNNYIQSQNIVNEQYKSLLQDMIVVNSSYVDKLQGLILALQKITEHYSSNEEQS